jgi:diguanylate cyclase (GGDEF)-like protein/PAS domain S-box-containing protein
VPDNLPWFDGDASPRITPPVIRHDRLIEGLSEYAIFGLSIDGRIASWNEGATQIFGYTADEVLGRDYAMLFSDDDLSAGRPQAELVASLEWGKTSVDGWHVRKDGTRFWCTDTIQTVRDERGAISGFSKVVRDYTESHIAAERLRESEERLRLLIEGVTEYAIFAVDPHGFITIWNSGAEHIFGYREKDVLGEHFSILYTPDAIARGAPEAELMEAACAGFATDEDWHVRQSGERFYATGQTTRLKPDAEGKPRGFVKVAHDITARNNAVLSITRQAFRDELTQLPNRAYFCDRLRQSIARCKDQPLLRFAVIFMDLDRFKIVNDSLGHTTADSLLVHVARTLERCVRPEDVVARLGGDEFTILLTDIRGPADAVRVAARIQADLAAPVTLDHYEVVTTASMGIAVSSPVYELPEQILRDADTAMYEAKTRGRARHVVFDAAMRDRAVGVLTLQLDLRRALARREFFIEYQPIVSLGRRRLIGFEALVRWNHPERGIVPPCEFIAEAESIGLITQIDRWVLDEACRQLHAWQLQFDDPALTVSVNLSSKHFSQENLVTGVRAALDASGVDPRCLKLEITETVLMERFEETAATAARVRDLGVDLYIDDFGTGYSSLSYLTRFPLQLLKVDRSFVSQTSSDPRSVEVVRAILSLARGLGLSTLAEGIETEEQFRQLRALGCEFGQGFWFSRPVRPDAAQTLIGHALPRARGRARGGLTTARKAILRAPAATGTRIRAARDPYVLRPPEPDPSTARRGQ